VLVPSRRHDRYWKLRIIVTQENLVRQRALLSYFESDIQQRNALGAVARRSWLAPSENLNLYDISRRAFDPALSAEEEFHVIYETLVGRWQVFRPRSSRDCWSSRRVFNKITGEFSEFSWRGSVSLLTPQGPLPTPISTCGDARN
jgi:hypothetical protein